MRENIFKANITMISRLCVLLLLIFSTVSCKNAATAKVQKAVIKERPNILFIMSDDHAYQAISAYCDKLINTPNIDRLAKEGMLFTNASVTCKIIWLRFRR